MNINDQSDNDDFLKVFIRWVIIGLLVRLIFDFLSINKFFSMT